MASSKENNPQSTLSSYYQTWLVEPVGHCSDGKLKERLGALGTVISLERPKLSSRASPATSILPMFLHTIAFTRAKHPPAQSSPPPPPPAQGPSTPAAIQFSSGGLRLSPTIPDRATSLPLPLTWNPPAGSDHNFPGRSLHLPTIPDQLPAVHPTPLSPLLPITSGPHQPSTHSANYILVPAKFSLPTTAPTAIAASKTCISTPQTHSPAQVDDLDAIFQYHPDNSVDASPDNVNACMDQASAGADPRLLSCDIIRLKSDMANLSDGLAKLAMEDPSFQPELSNRQEAESYLLKMLQGSLQTCNFLRSIVDKQNYRHITITGSL